MAVRLVSLVSGLLEWSNLESFFNLLYLSSLCLVVYKGCKESVLSLGKTNLGFRHLDFRLLILDLRELLLLEELDLILHLIVQMETRRNSS